MLNTTGVAHTLWQLPFTYFRTEGSRWERRMYVCSQSAVILPVVFVVKRSAMRIMQSTFNVLVRRHSLSLLHDSLTSQNAFQALLGEYGSNPYYRDFLLFVGDGSVPRRRACQVFPL